MAAFPHRNEEIPCDIAVPASQFIAEDGPFVLEPWMKDVLNESAFADAPLDWDVIDSYSSAAAANPVSLNDGSLHSTLFDCAPRDLSVDDGDACLTRAEGPQSFCSTPFQPADSQSTHSFAAPNPVSFSVGPSDYQSTCPSLSPETPLLDRSPLQDHFASFSTEASPQSLFPVDASQLVFDQVAAAFRDLARARAEADPRPLSRKQKQRDASIALYLQRLRDTCNEAVAILNFDAQLPPQYGNVAVDTANQPWFQEPVNFDEFISFQPCHASSSSNVWPTTTSSRSSSAQSGCAAPSSNGRSTSPSPPSVKRQRTAAGPVTGGVELVMDLNMNVATTVPRKHKPRTQAQRERYLAVRSQGACEKHKRQHKRCTCIDDIVNAKLSSQEQNSARRSRANRPTQPARALTPKTEPPRVASGEDPAQSHRDASGLCPAGCLAGHCHCSTRDADDLRRQISLPALTDQQPPAMIRTHQRSHSSGREVSANRPTSRSPDPTTTRTSADANSPVTWDLAAVSRNACRRTDSQRDGHRVAPDQSRSTENRNVTHSTTDRRDTQSLSASGGALQVVPDAGHARASPLQTSTCRGSTRRGSAGTLHLESARSNIQPISQSTSCSPSPSPSPSDVIRSSNSIPQSADQSVKWHRRQQAQRKQNRPEQSSAVNSGTLPPRSNAAIYRDKSQDKPSLYRYRHGPPRSCGTGNALSALQLRPSRDLSAAPSSSVSASQSSTPMLSRSLRQRGVTNFVHAARRNVQAYISRIDLSGSSRQGCKRGDSLKSLGFWLILWGMYLTWSLLLRDSLGPVRKNWHVYPLV
ncbi:hypothetical protein VTO42DRAFT_187 [Malbranchea cinnamomea]